MNTCVLLPTSLRRQTGHFSQYFLMFRCYSNKTKRCCECGDKADKGFYCKRYVAETQQTMNTETNYGMLWEKGDHLQEKQFANENDN